MSTARVLFDVQAPLAFVTFNRPEALNAMTTEMYGALVAACDEVDRDPAIRVLVLRGAGGKAFIAGTDIAQFTSFRSREDGIAYERQLDEIVDRVERVKAATIAQVQGVATGGGFVLALACDLRVCTPDSRFGVPIARTLGNCLSAANTARLLDLVGPARAKDVLMTARLVDAAEAASLGLVTRVADASAIDAVVGEMAALIASHAPLTIQATKELIRRTAAARRLPAAQADDLIALCYTSDDFREGVESFLAKRPARFAGR